MNKPALLVKSNLEWLLKSRNINAHELARCTGVPQPTIHRILTGESADPRTSTLQGLATYFGIAVSNLRDVDLATGKKYWPNSPLAIDKNVKPVAIGSRAIPVISAIQAGQMREISQPYGVGDGYATIYVDDGYSPWVFALEIEGDSMTPDYQEGDIVIIEPEWIPRPGECVAARNGSQEATFKRYRQRGIDKAGNEIFELVPINENYPTMRSDETPLTVIGVMAEHRRKARRR